MKKKLIFFCLIIFTGYILIFPKDAVTAAATGLMLWYQKILPTLLPFAILSNILIYSNYLQYINRLFAPVIKMLFPVSDNGAFVVLSGFLFGFPMGSKNCAELLKCGKIEQKEADILFAVTNNISPVFISSYILYQQLHLPSLTIISYLVLYLPPLLIGRFLLGRAIGQTDSETTQRPLRPSLQKTERRPASGSQMNFKIIDAGIMNGFETLTRLGGYIMLFSMIASIVSKLPFSPQIRLLITGITEITNGINLIPQAPLSLKWQYIFAMGFTAFGGLSGIAQTSSMILDTRLSLAQYLRIKLLLTVCSILLAWTVTICFRL